MNVDPLRQYYVYQATIAFTATAAGTIGSDTFRITDTPFVCTFIGVTHRAAVTGRHIMTASDDGADEIGGLPDVAATLQIEETGADRVLSQVQIDGFLYHCNRARPLPVPRLFKRATTVTVNATLRKTTAAVSTLRVMFEGFLDYSGKAG